MTAVAAYHISPFEFRIVFRHIIFRKNSSLLRVHCDVVGHEIRWEFRELRDPSDTTEIGGMGRARRSSYGPTNSRET